MNLPFLQSPPGAETVALEGEFDAPVARVFRAWTDAEALMKWFGPEDGILLHVVFEPRAGGNVCFEFRTEENLRSAIEGKILEITENERLSFTWSHIVVDREGARTATPASKVTVEFSETASGTRVALRHEDIQTADGRTSVSGGWSGTFVRLGAFVADEAGTGTSG